MYEKRYLIICLKLVAAPSSQFRFQSEKEWEETDTKLQVNKQNYLL